jgi:hypothetical protein
VTTARFPDVVNELIFWVEATFPTTAAAGHTPATWPTGAFTFVRVGIVGGTDDRITDYSRVDIEVFSDTYAAARALAEDIRQGLQPRAKMESTTIDTVRTITSPQELPWGNPAVRRLLATYQVSVRR